MFTTFPQPYESVWAGLFDQILGTALLLLGIFAIGDDQNQARSESVQAFCTALLVVAIGMSFGYVTAFIFRAP